MMYDVAEIYNHLCLCYKQINAYQQNYCDYKTVGSSTLTLFVPLASRTSFSLALVVRALIGLSQAATFPSCFYFYPRCVIFTNVNNNHINILLYK
jgi:hypothetical protein